MPTAPRLFGPLLYNGLQRDVAQLGSALPWGGRGREFKSHRSDQLTKNALDLPRLFVFFLLRREKHDKAHPLFWSEVRFILKDLFFKVEIDASLIPFNT